jgi:hypothetical protein
MAAENAILDCHGGIVEPSKVVYAPGSLQWRGPEHRGSNPAFASITVRLNQSQPDKRPTTEIFTAIDPVGSKVTIRPASGVIVEDSQAALAK